KKQIPYVKKRMFSWVIDLNEETSFKIRLKRIVKNIFNIFQEKRILSLMKKEKIELVHINALTSSWGAISALKLNIPLVWHIREILEEGINKRFLNDKKSINLINESNKIIAISKSVKNYYTGILNSNKLVHIYNGIDVKDFQNKR